ncbi:DUF881 domain-containing protein [Bacillus sp. 2205SS5-2]|uniref:DUF881 domain-containing protein n=1 Tax=Bacillus sp. 2205SS5-2 TaxID=3109031 RepID=UPI003005CB9D
MKSKYVILSFVCLVLGFMLSFSYSQTRQNEEEHHSPTSLQWREEDNLRTQIISQSETNNMLQDELFQKRNEVSEHENELSEEEEIFFNLVEDANKYRLFLGEVKAKGPGVKVILADGDYNPSEENVNNYIVHEHHVFKVINELYISGATAVAINGKRLSHSSYIICNGPVITVDGEQFPAPFEITAIGEPDFLQSALNIVGGVKDQLVNDNIVFSLEMKSTIVMDPVITES